MNITDIVKRSHRAGAVRKTVIGFLGGAVATGPMTIAMLELHRLLPPQEKQPLPPREITTALAKAVGVSHALGETGISTLTLLNHFAYGSAAGAGYALVMPHPRHQSLPKGLVFGLLLWGLSYIGLLPGLNILRPATQHSAPRTLLMICVHLIWGAVLASFVRVLLGEARRTHGALAGHSALPHFEAH